MSLDRTLRILEALVGFDTTSRNSNLELIAWIAAYLDRHGVAYERFPSPDGRKASLYATIGPAAERGYVLSGHTDVVPVDGQDWATDPFALTIVGDRAYGRGACDMKGFVASCLAMVPDMVAAPLARPIHLAFSYDEEVGCTGVRPMLQALAGRAVQPLGAFIGEPTSMKVVVGHKGSKRMRVEVRGRAAHSSLAPTGVNAVAWGARLVAHVQDVAEETARSGARDELYDVPHTTLHVGVFHGGTASNIVPHEAEFMLEVRAIGTESPADRAAAIERWANEVLTPRMREIDPDAGFAFVPMVEVAGLETPPEAAIVTLAKRLSGRNDHAKVAFGTEAGYFTKIAAMPAVVLGPGDIAQAHRPDEFIALAELEKSNAFIGKLITHCRAG